MMFWVNLIVFFFFLNSAFNFIIEKFKVPVIKKKNMLEYTKKIN